MKRERPTEKFRAERECRCHLSEPLSFTNKETDAAANLQGIQRTSIFLFPVWGSVHYYSLSQKKSNWENLKRRLKKRKMKGQDKMRPFLVNLLKMRRG